MTIIRYVITAVLAAWRYAAQAAQEAAAEAFADAFKWSRRAKLAGSHALVGAGAALAVPGAAIGLLGRLFPAAPVTPAQVAHAAVAEDEAVYAAAPVPEPAPLTLPELVRLHAGALPMGADEADLPPLPQPLAVWISEMGPDSRRLLGRMPAASIERHLDATDPRHLIAGISRVPTEAEMLQRDRDIADALAAMEADGRMDKLRADMLRDMRFDADDRVGSVPAFA